ncbi:MAG: porin [Gemmataceae bacterium]|nr:porin [Gemmataceae bacterium]
MSNRCRDRGSLMMSLVAVIVATQTAPAQERVPLPQDFQQRLERLEKLNEMLLRQNEELKRELQALKATTAATAPVVDKSAVQSLVSEYLQQQVAKEKAAAARDSFEVGSDLKLTARWNHGVWLETADKAFKGHFGGRVQFDTVWMDAPSHVIYGAGGIGRLDDGAAFRRARLEVDGTFYEVVDFFCEFDFVNTFNVDPSLPVTRNGAADIPAPTDLWAQVTHLPYLGVVRVGNQKPPIGLDHLTSSRFLPFLERSFLFDAFIGGLNNGFVPGIQLINWTESERFTWAVGIFKNNQNVLGWNVGDGEWDVTGRVTWLPLYRDNGRCLIHLGLGYSHRDVDESIYRLRARPLLRNGPGVLHNALANVVIEADNQDVICPEVALQWGQFSMQAEYCVNWFARTRFPAGVEQGTTFFHSAYVQVLYFLTPGDYVTYNTKLGSGPAFARVIPQRPFYWVRGPGHNIFSSGAWQIGARYSWIDLDNKTVQAGTLHDLTLGLNWYLNANIKFQWNLSLAYRDAANDASDGWVRGFGVRMAYDF